MWGEWSAYGACSVTCGYGKKWKTRSCDSPAPAHGGNDCVGDERLGESCGGNSCPRKYS